MNSFEFKVFGMRRSGNHAVLHWIASHFNEPCWLVNDIKDFRKPAPLEEDYVKADELDCFKAAVGVDGFWEMDKGVLIQTYEDYDLSDLSWHENRRVAGESEREVVVLILRDPFNLFASRMAKGMPYVVPVSGMAMERWKQHAKEAIGETDYLRDPWGGEYIAKNRRFVVVNYNKWLSQPMYRRALELEMGLPGGENDESMDRVVMAGSSFSGMGKDGDAGSMSLTERWVRYRHEPSFMGLFDERVKDLAMRCGFKCPWEDKR